ncbi:hypothetical protein Hypma_009613 [Hypsizygus marmoreus]|uniref:NmrA-like domain-containing protein n=1 Tax=Hypsizygus marmoreus TaxID=39966 RepID=A0A369JLU8_HYPMA|nr:hypothetical protein Hypma_009613 [Hypsizygus marmoreus]
MSKFTSFAIVGAGYIGLPITKALASQNVFVVVLTRSSAKTEIPEGVKIAPVDYDNIATVIQVLKEHRVEVVISTLGPAGWAAQNTAAEAAKAAGVKLFVPSEFGVPTEGTTAGFMAAKDKSAKYIQSLGLPTARFYNGFFTEGLLDVVGFSTNGKVNIVGKGDKPISWTSMEDVAGFVAHVLTTLPESQLEYSTFRLQGDRATLIDIASILKTTPEFVKEVPGPGGERATQMQALFEAALGSTGYDANVGGDGKAKAGSANDLWPNHHWKSVKEVFNV